MLLKSSIPLLLIAGMTDAVQLDAPCETAATDCSGQGCDGKNDVEIAIDFNVNAPSAGHHHHDAPLPSALDAELARINAELDEATKQVEI